MNNLDYPELNEEGQKHAELLIESFKKELIKCATKTISELYMEIGCYIESDSWTNYRNSIMAGLRNYNTNERRYDFQRVRAEILKEHREEIIKDLNQDLLKQIEELKSELKHAYERR